MLPVKVVLNFTYNFVPATGGGAAQLGAGCTGDADSQSIDLILDVRGDGQTYGPGDDAVRISNASPGARNIQITGKANCGKKQGAAHQDGIQAIGGTDITFADFEVGNFDGGVATCQGAGGGLFYSSAAPIKPVRLSFVRGKIIACNHALIDGGGNGASGQIVGTKFRSHRHLQNTVPPVPRLCQDGNGGPYATAKSVLSNPNVAKSGITMQYWNGATQQWTS